jgi:hypothetical protein
LISRGNLSNWYPSFELIFYPVRLEKA